MQIQDIKELMEKMSQTGLNVVEFETEGGRLRLEKSETSGSTSLSDGCNAANCTATQQAAAAGPGAADTAAEPAVPEGHLVTSPVIGVYYTAPSPDSDPFVSVGSVVETGSPLCIIEAMKLMNEVTSECDGIVLELLVENGMRVEYGQPLMRIGGN